MAEHSEYMNPQLDMKEEVDMYTLSKILNNLNFAI